MGASVGFATLSIIPSAKGFGAALGGAAFSGPMAKTGSKSAKTFGASFAAGLKVLKLGGLVAAAVGVGVGVGLFKLGKGFDAEFDKIRVGTGATGELLTDLEGSFKDVLRTVPSSFGDAGTAVADLNTRLGLTGDVLEARSGQFINLSRITKTDLGQNIDDITRVFGDWGVATDMQSTALDQIYRASQASGAGINDLSTSVVQFGAPLRNLGFGFEDSLALLAQFNKTGVNTETVFAGLKAGVGKLAKEGEPIPDVFNRIVGEITAMGPGTEATALAIELFGQRAGPDLADAIAGGKFEIEGMLNAIANGSDTIDGAAKDTESFGEKWNLFKNKILVGLEPLATKVFDGIGSAMDTIGPKIEPVITWFSVRLPAAMAAVKQWVSSNWPAIRAVIANVFDWLIDKAWPQVSKVLDQIVTAAASVVEWFRENWSEIRSAVADVFDWIADNKDVVIGALVALGVAAATVLVPSFIAWAAAAGAAAAATIAAAAPFVAIGVAIAALGAGLVWAYQNVGWFRSAVDSIARFFTGTVIPAVKSFIAVVADVIRRLVSIVRNNWDTIQMIITTVFDAVATYVKTAWGIISGVVSGAIEVIRGVIKTVTSLIEGDWSGVWEGIQQIFRGVWDAITSYLSGVLELLAGLLGLAWDAMKAALGLAWDAMKAAISVALDAVVSFMRDLPGRLVSALGDLLSLLVPKGNDVISGLQAGIRHIWASIVLPWLQSLPGLIISGLGSLIGTLYSAGSDLFDGLKAGITIVWGRTLSWLGELPGKILTAIGDLGRILYDVGRAIIQGLLDGIGSMAGRIADAVLGPISGAVGGVKSFLGINSPSRVFMSIGQDTMEGLRLGLESGRPGVESIVDSFRSVDLSVSASPSRYSALVGSQNTDRPSGDSHTTIYAANEPQALRRELEMSYWREGSR